MPISKVWIYRLLFVCLFVFCTVTISQPRIKLAASNFARRFIGVQGRESPIFVNFAPQKPQIGQIGQHACVMLLGFCDSHAYQGAYQGSRGVWT